jgi:lysozyme
MKDISKLTDFLKRFEGVRLTAYLDSVGVWTIGVGSTGSDIKKGVTWTADYAEKRLRDHCDYVLKALFDLSPTLAQENDNRQVAIASFAYNLGVGAYQGSTLRKCVNAGDWTGAQAQILRWDKANVHGKMVPLAGLTKRRKAESELLGIQ